MVQEAKIMPRVTHVQALSGYRLHVKFDDGVTGEIEMADRLFGPAFEPLHDIDELNKVFVDEFGAIAWPCGVDLAPDAIHRRLTAAVLS